MMAQAPKTRCPRCKQLKQGRCVGCARTGRKRKPAERDGFYDTQGWRRLRAAHITENPLCVECFKAGKIRAAEEVDHIKPRQDAPELELEASNLQSLCKSHHSRKSNRERAERVTL